MKTHMLASLVVAAGLALGGLVAHNVNAQTQPAPVQPSPVKRTVTAKTEVPGTNIEVISAIVEIAPNFKAGRHFHPGVVHAQVLEGEFWFAIDGEAEKTAKAGESLALSDRVVHNEGAGATGTKLVATYVVEKGQPLVQPAK